MTLTATPKERKLRSIAAEAKACRAAWAAMPDATAGAHIHHGSGPFELLRKPVENRIAYILSDKPKSEQALRLRLMRPVTAPALAEYERVAAWAEYERRTAPALAEYERVAAWAEYERVRAAAHRDLCPTPDCPWDGVRIFGDAS